MNQFRAQGLVTNGAQGLVSNVAKNDDSNVDDNAEYMLGVFIYLLMSTYLALFAIVPNEFSKIFLIPSLQVSSNHECDQP